MKSSLSSLPPFHVAHSIKPSALPNQGVVRPKVRVPMPETIASVALVIVGAVHGVLFQNAWDDAHYKGVLFVLNALLSLIFAFNLVRGDRFAGWLGGALICASSALAYVASRTIGLPQLPAEPAAWLEPMGVLSLLAEVSFTLVFLRAFVYDDDNKDQL